MEDNIPTANDFAYISHDEGKKLLFDGFTSEVSSAIDSIVLGNKTFSGTELDISNKNLFVSSEPKAALPIKVNIIERSELSRVVIPTLPPISNILSPGNEFFSVESSKFPATVSFSSEGNVEYRSNGLFVGEKQIANVDVSGYRVFISPTPDFSKILGSGDWDQDENGQYSFDFGKTVKVWDGDEYISFSFITNQKDTVKQFIDALPNNIGQSIQAVKK